MKKILVHICCGVDAVYALRKLKEEFPDSYIEGYFYDPNIHPEEEYLLRWIETERVCNDLGIKCHLAPYELEIWLDTVKGLENEPERGERCTVCHDLRLEKTAQFAKERGFDSITTVLMMSPKKDFEILKSVGESVASKYQLEFLSVDFRKNGGIEKMNKLSREYQLYHQNYCGCMYALFQQKKGEYIKELVSYGRGRLPGSREELTFIKSIRKYAENLGLKCTEESFNFVNWRALSSSLKINKEPVPHTVLWFSHSIKGVLRAKVKEIISDTDKKIVKLNKSNAQIWILDTSLKEISLEMPRLFTHPIFIIGKEYGNMLKENAKVELQLKAEFEENGRSQNLFIGNLDACTILEFHSDTLADGSEGFSYSDIKKAIDDNRQAILKGETGIAIYGAKTIGNIGKRFSEKHTVNI
ncbi:hypothetical protein SAMN06265182_0452 [Persephonella hydrogeniphila]|uniref:Epoxyqueuosine reductase QueH n=1 Tax=Persephonella hydrogeniphila TaxID=198703 RepID=A0A285N443_9AQUI|nr:epoxyqueuosine reductase QueH [Persephonella hydrogeniphila]SNZ03713.1 hypothetical protein SAMN06265182_0452 [Persephonella hydrogeniphila]